MVEVPRLIAFTGLAGSGKTTAAQYLVEQHGYVRTRFADPLKSMLRSIGLGHEEIDGSRKELPSSLLCGKTPRHAMQTLGSEWGRECIGPKFWIALWSECAAECLDQGGRVVVDDCRFGNEAEVVRRLGGQLVRISGRGGISGQHASEELAFSADLALQNDNDLSAFLTKVGLLVTR